MKLLITLWEDSTCSGVSRCMLHRTVLHTASKYLESDILLNLSQFLILGTKASRWCRTHFEVTLTSVEEFQEEQHRSLFYQLILDSLSLSSAVISSMTKSLPFGEKVDMLIVENFIFEILSLTKDLILELKRIDLIASEALKLGQIVLDAAVKLCRAYYQVIRSKVPEVNVVSDDGLFTGKVEDYACHIISITVCTIENLFNIGTFAASGGGSFVTILNISWKGVVCLLQLDKSVLAEKVNVENIILTLISLTVESLRYAADAWSSSSSVSAALTEAKRTFLPIKFYLINSVRITSEYPCNAMNICSEVVRCVVLISSLCIILSKEIHLKAVSEAIAELVEPTSFLLLHTLLNSAEVKIQSKVQILEWLFPHEINPSTPYQDRNIYTASLPASLDGVFNVSCDAMPGAESLLLGKFYLSLNLLKASSSLREEIILQISRKLDVLMSILTHADVFSSVLGLQIPVLNASGPSTGVVWQPMFSFVSTILKSFMIVTASSKLIWIEIEIFLLQNLFHSHFLCLEIVKELLCFFICHAENDKVSQIFEKLCLLLRTVASSDHSLSPSSPLRKMARSISYLLSYTTTATVDQVYITIVSEENSDLSSVMYMALLIEGFPLDSLSEKLKIVATRKIISAFVAFIEKNSKELELDAAASLSCNSGLLGLPILAVSSAICSRHIKSSDAIDGKVSSQLLKFTTTVIQKYRKAGQGMKNQYAKLLGAILELFSIAKHLYGYVEMREIILELQKLFVESDASLSQCQPYFASFMACLCHIQIEEDAENPLSAAIWHLYHFLLRERHWAFVHLAIAAFGYFAARTSCTQLWRFVPSNAALSFEFTTGREANYDIFMNELKGFLEKEGALCEASPCKEQLSFLFNEGIALIKLTKISNILQDVPAMQTVETNCPGKRARKKRRQLPDGICEGMDLLQNGLKIMKNALLQPDSKEFMEEFSAHISCLNDVISHLVSLYNSHL
ncbi:uncharacterized protein LOC110018014 [Phalaenopsis equestris]|uniref:uncharacterized protein LOC110018014 n=1 Tax=Phalaenopsis equestris TaxID=78828 RepID=UPI0009E2C90D|nr:uncharacterized protein LOC110018014 [Phalaenopsis equestris]